MGERSADGGGLVEVVRHRAGDAGVSSGFAEIVLGRTEKRNALTPAMLMAVRGAVGELAEDAGVRAIALVGEGKSFCAGFDLGLMGESAESLRAMLSGLSEAVAAFRECRKPVVVGVQGAAVAGGCALVCGADVVVSHGSAKLGYPVTRLGVSPAVSAPTLAGMVGLGAARARALDPGLMDGNEAARIGLVHVLVDSAEDVRPRTQLVAQKLASKPPGAVEATKRWMNRVDPWFGSESLAAGLEASLSLVGGEEERRLIRGAIDGSEA